MIRLAHLGRPASPFAESRAPRTSPRRGPGCFAAHPRGHAGRSHRRWLCLGPAGHRSAGARGVDEPSQGRCPLPQSCALSRRAVRPTGSFVLSFLIRHRRRICAERTPDQPVQPVRQAALRCLRLIRRASVALPRPGPDKRKPTAKAPAPVSVWPLDRLYGTYARLRRTGPAAHPEVPITSIRLG